MNRCTQCFNFETYCTCDSDNEQVPYKKTKLIIPPPEPKLHTGFYL